ncbi:TolC family protein [Anaerotignum sp.]
MKFYQYKKACALLVTGALTAGTAVPAFAAETKQAEETTELAAEAPKAEPMTLEEIQKLVLKNNRLKTTLELNAEKVAAGLNAIDDGLDELRDTQDDAARARRQASQAASAGQAGAGQVGQIGGILGGAVGVALGGLADISGGLLSGSVKTASAMEDMVDSIADQQRDVLEDQQKELKNTKQDLNKTKEDWDNEALAVTQLLVTKTVQVEKGVGLLSQKQALLERVCQIEEKKAELGFSTPTDLSGKKLEVSQGAKDLQDAKDGLTLLKRQLNDLMGRELDEELNITPPELTRVIETAPAYSEELLKTATDKNYKLKTLRRDKQQAEKDSKDTTKYDGQIKASRLDMDLADVAMQDQQANIANDLKKKLDRINAAAAVYQNKKDAYAKAKTEWEQQQVSAKLGLVSAVELQALQLQFEQTEMELSAAAYDYDLAWAEYNMLMDGTTLDIYDTYKAQLG